MTASLVSQTAPWNVSQVMELAVDLSEVALPWAQSGAPIADAGLFEFWSQGRQLTAEWLRRIELLDAVRQRQTAVDYDLVLEGLASEVGAIEAVSRIYATTLGALDRVRSTPEYRPIAENALLAIQHVRVRLNHHVVGGGERLASVDRFRRRCERWTDLLIGPLLVRYGTSAFAHDARRAWEFGEDLLADAGREVARQLVRPTVLAAFRGQPGRLPIRSPSGNTFLQAIISAVPLTATTPSLQRWKSPVTGPLTAPQTSDHQSHRIPVEHHPEWSLLERCLGIVARDRRQGK